MERVSIGPKPLFYLVIIAAIALGVALFVYAPDPLALIDQGGRPSKGLAVIKWGGGLIALLGVWRLYVIRRVSAGPDGITISSWLSSRRHDWSDLKDANLDTVEGSPPGYRLRFGTYSMFLLRREYSPAAIAKLREVVKAHRS